MNIIDDQKLEVEFLRSYYKEHTNELNIIGLNDDRGFHINKNILLFLKETLQNEELKVQTINAASFVFNKTQHIDYFLKHNLSLEEIELIQKNENKIILEQQLGFSLPFLKPIYNKGTKGSSVKHMDKKVVNLHISDVIKNANEPMIICTSGISNMMDELHINPFDLATAYKKRNVSSKYEYAVSNANIKTIKKVIDGNKHNFENLLSLNAQSDIYVVGTYLHKTLHKEYEKPFKEAVLMYNHELETLCNQYNITYINSRVLGKNKYDRPIINYTNKYPSYYLAKKIIFKMCENKATGKQARINTPSHFKIDNEGIFGLFSDIDYDMSITRTKMNSGTEYEREIMLDRLKTQHKERKVLEKILTHEC